MHNQMVVHFVETLHTASAQTGTAAAEQPSAQSGTVAAEQPSAQSGTVAAEQPSAQSGTVAAEQPRRYPRGMDEGAPISYEVLGDGVPVYGSDGVQVGTVGSVIAAPEQDVFHGVVISTSDRTVHFVAADQIASIHEQGVDLRIDSAAAALLPAPTHGARVYDAEDPGLAKGWHHWVRVATRHGDWNRER
jgi:hypothetical protein